MRDKEQGAGEGGRSWRPVDVLLGVIRRVELDDPVNIRNVQAPERVMVRTRITTTNQR